jgi:hypothetical protein
MSRFKVYSPDQVYLVPPSARDESGSGQTTDNRQLLPMFEQVKQNTGRKPDAASADAGYWSQSNATDAGVVGIDLHIVTGRDKH